MVHNYAIPCNILVYASVLIYMDVIHYVTDKGYFPSKK